MTKLSTKRAKRAKPPAAASAAPQAETLKAEQIEETNTPNRRLLPPKLRLTADADGKLGGKLEAASQLEAASHADLASTFGSLAPEFVDQAINDLINIVVTVSPQPEGPVNTMTINAMLQAIAAAEPKSELEAMLAIQMAAFHHVTLDCLRRAMNPKATVEGRQLNLGYANKCGRTFATLLEALNRHRGKVTTQKVIVENVHVAAGGQAVVGAVAGVGAAKSGAHQVHATEPENQNPRGHRPALSCPDAPRDAMSASGGEGQEALQDARLRSRKRRAEGQPQQLEARALDRGRKGRAPDDSRAAAKRARTERVNVLNRSE